VDGVLAELVLLDAPGLEDKDVLRVVVPAEALLSIKKTQGGSSPF
jgi:hypothetical protein